MREIKFRVWCEDRKEMLPIQRHSFKTNKSMPYGWNMQYEFDAIMQYTGLKDKNGKEIYEGDIVETSYDGVKNPNYVVVFDTSELDFKATNGRVDYKDNYQYLASADYVEVIGNIYENPELLEK